MRKKWQVGHLRREIKMKLVDEWGPITVVWYLSQSSITQKETPGKDTAS